MTMLPAVRANLKERFIFNFRMPPEAMAKYLPATWLAPQEINGFGVVSYCLLELHNITIAPLAPTVGLNSISCAPRFAVIDTSGAKPKPAVFVTERQTNSAFGSWFTTLGFSAPHPYVEAVIEHEENNTNLRVNNPQEAPLFSAQVQRTSQPNSQLFCSTEDFVAFIAQGVSSYGASIRGNRLTKLDLHKQDGHYEPLEVTRISGPVVEEWNAAGAEFDSAFRTSGGLYEWTYLGLTD